MPGKKRELPPALRENADKLKRGEALSNGKKKAPLKVAKKTARKAKPKSN